MPAARKAKALCSRPAAGGGGKEEEDTYSFAQKGGTQPGSFGRVKVHQ